MFNLIGLARDPSRRERNRHRGGPFVRLAVPVDAAFNLVSALAACEGLPLVGVSVIGVWGTPTDAHDPQAFWARSEIVNAEGSHRFVLLNGHKEPSRQDRVG